MIIIIVILSAIILTISVVCIYLGRTIARGEGDSLIAGYGTAKKEERERYDIARLRRLTSTALYVMAALTPLFCVTPLLPEQYAMIAIPALVAIMCAGIAVYLIWGIKWTRKD